MSSCPGLTLEDFVMWDLNIKVVLREDANESLAIAEFLGTATYQRPTLTEDQFKLVLELYEPYREQVEYKLRDFDEESQSWRDYAGYNFDFIPQQVSETAINMIRSL